jgi:hypothetical protein
MTGDGVLTAAVSSLPSHGGGDENWVSISSISKSSRGKSGDEVPIARRDEDCDEGGVRVVGPSSPSDDSTRPILEPRRGLVRE